MSNQGSNSTLISLIYKSRLHILNIMERLGFNINDYKDFSINEVNSMTIHNQLDMILEKTDETTNSRKEKIYIKYYLDRTITDTIIQEIIDDLFNLEEILTKKDTLYIITKNELNDSRIETLNNIWERDGIFVILQNIQRLQFNILDNQLVPPTRCISDEEYEKVRLMYNITDKSLLPEISRYDPVCQVICLRPGQVCEILRPSKTSIETKYYRLCVQTKNPIKKNKISKNT